MLSIMKIVVLLGLLLITGSANLAAYGQEVVSVNIGNVVFSAPYYQPGEAALSNEAKGFYDGLAGQLHQDAEWLVNTAIGGNLGVISAGTPIRAQGIIASQQECAQLASDHDIHLDPQFKVHMVGIFDDLIHSRYLKKSSSGMMNFSKSKNKKAKARENLESYLGRLGFIFDGAYQLAINSPVSLHLDYRRMTIDGNLAVREINSIFQKINEARLTYQRYPVVFEFFNTIIKNI